MICVMTKLHLVDGTYELFRSYFGAPKRTNAEGHQVGALRGLLHSMITLLHEDDVTQAQCVRGNVTLRDRMRKKTYDADGVVEKFGVPPASIPDYLALVGDDADGIPGIPRWGAKSTGAVLTRYGHIEHIPDDPTAWDIKVRGSKTLAENLSSRRDDALLYRTLATLRTDAPANESLDELRWAGADIDALEAMCAWLGDTRAMKRLPTP